MSGPSNQIDPALEGQWRITGYLDADGNFVEPVEGSNPYLVFGSEGLTGSTGCNTFFGTVDALEGGTWTAEELGMTLMGCPPALADQETAITTAITSATAWNVDGDTAELVAAGIPVLGMEKVEATLVGAWSVTGINNGKGGVTSVLATLSPTLAFGNDDALIAWAGCNNLVGTYVAGDTELEVSGIAATRKMCSEPEGVMEQESNLVTALGNAASYEIRVDSLTIRDADGSTQVTATRIIDTP